MENIEVLVRPRLNDYHGILMLQDKVDFAIPFLDEDIPLYVDPFLLWKSPSQMDNDCTIRLSKVSTIWDF